MSGIPTIADDTQSNIFFEIEENRYCSITNLFGNNDICHNINNGAKLHPYKIVLCKNSNYPNNPIFVKINTARFQKMALTVVS